MTLRRSAIFPGTLVQTSAFELACARYARVRRLVYAEVAHQFRVSGVVRVPFSLTDIDARALDAWKRSWVVRPGRDGGWDWTTISKSVLRRPNSLPIALWAGERLVGLAAGRCSKRRASGFRMTVSLAYLEADHDPDHPLRGRVALIITSAAVAYASALGARRVRLLHPLPRVWMLYEALGFQLASDPQLGIYFERRI